MKRIATVNREIDKFGAGKDGFRAAVPGVSDPTYLSAAWCNAVQEALVRVIEGAGLIPSDDHGQLLTALAAQFVDPLAAPTGAARVGYGVQTLAKFLDRTRPRFGRGSTADLPRFMATIRNYRHDLQAPITIFGAGSSVGVGATLPNPAADAPVNYFASRLKALFDPGGLYNIVVTNQSVNGSVASDFPAAWAARAAAGFNNPGIAVFAYGMNDQAVASYNNGQTFPGFYTAMRSAIITAKKAGWDVVILTTPHPSVVQYPGQVAMPVGIAQAYPTAVAANVAPESLGPPASASTITADFLGEGTAISVGHRALRINQAMRDVAKEFGCALVDSERYWFEALQKYQLSTGSAAGAEAMLFNAGEIVHPNLLGHTESYHKAIDDFIFALAKQSGQNNVEPRFNGYIGANLPGGLPGAVLDLNAPYGDMTTKPFSAKAAIGVVDANGIKALAEVVYIDPATGDLVTPAVRIAGKIDAAPANRPPAIAFTNYLGEKAPTDIHAVYNIAAGGTVTYTLPDNKGGQLSIRCTQPGVALSQLYVNEFSCHNGVTTLGAARQIGAGTEFSISVTGVVVTITAVFATSSFYIRTDAW